MVVSDVETEGINRRIVLIRMQYVVYVVDGGTLRRCAISRMIRAKATKEVKDTGLTEW